MMHELPDARELHLTDRRIEEMKAFSLWVSVAAIGVTVGLAGNAWCQTTTQTDSTVSTTSGRTEREQQDGDDEDGSQSAGRCDAAFFELE